MKKGRLEAFSDGVIAIIITIMVLELKVPHGADMKDLEPLIPVILSYILSFIFIGIYWNNHHHLIHAADKVTGNILWANLHLLFWLSLVPFVSAWMGENHFAPATLALYGVILFMSGIAYYILQTLILKINGKDSPLAKAVGTDFKGKASPVFYAIAIPSAYLNQWLSGGLYIAVAMMWLIPDRRIEHLITNKNNKQ